MKAVNVRKERTILACFSALDPGLAGSCLARVGVDPAAALAEADPDTVCHALGQLVANRDNVTLSTLLPCLSLRPEMPLPLARLSVRAAHTFQNNSIDTVGQLSMMSCSDLLALKNTGGTTISEIAEFAVRMHLELSSEPEAACFLESAVCTAAAADTEVADLVPIDPILAALNSVLRRLGAWAAEARSASTIGDLIQVRTDLGHIPTEVEEPVRDLLATSLSHLRPRADAAQRGLNCLLEGLDERSRRIFIERLPLPGRRTLEEIGKLERLTRERVRQLGAQAEGDLQGRLALPEAETLRWRIHELSTTLQNGGPLGSPLVKRALAHARRDLNDGAETVPLLLWAAGPYRVSGGWLIKQGCEVPRLPTDERLWGEEKWISLDAITEWVAAQGFSRAVVPTIIEQSSVRQFGEVWAPWTGNVLDKAEIVLRSLGRPADSRELVEMIDEGHNEQGVRNRLFNDDRFVRTNRRSFALATWDLEEYAGIVAEIVERINRDGGSMSLEALATELVSTFGVSESSVRAYAEAPMFILDGGEVRLRRMEESRSIDSRFESVKGLFPDPTRNLVHLMVQVDAGVERGSGFSIEEPFAAALGIGPGDRLEFATDHGGRLGVSWPETGILGPYLGSTRTLAESVGAATGDDFLITFDLEAGSAKARRINKEDNDIEALTGLKVEPGHELDALAQSIGCQRATVRAVLARRGDRAVVDALPRRAEQPALDDALSRLADLLAD